MDTSYVESVTASLVREYLSRKGLKITLERMDEEMPRDSSSISNRMQLKKALQIEKLMARNKESKTPLKAMLEVIAKSLIDKAHARAVSTLPERPKSSRSGSFPQAAPEQDPSSSEASSLAASTGSNFAPKFGKLSIPSRGGSLGVGADLVIDDDVDGETLLGDGRAGLLGADADDTDSDIRFRQPTMTVNRPKSRLRGMAGPIASNTEEHDRRNRFGRVKSSARPVSGRPKPEPVDVEPAIHSNGLAITTSTPSSREPSARVTAARPTAPPSTTSASSGLARRESGPGSLGDIDGSQGRRGALLRHRGSRDSTGEPEDDDGGDKDLSGDGSDSWSRSNSLEEDPSPEPRTGSSGTKGRSGSGPRRERRDETLTQYGVSRSCVVSEKTPKPVNFLDAVNNTRPRGHGGLQDLELGEVDELDAEVAKLDLRPRKPLMNPTMISDSRPIDIQTAMELKTLCLGSASKCFNEEWVDQAFTFCDLPRLTYGIVQRKGGPCGLLASVQACMLQHLLFAKRDKNEPPPTTKFDFHPEQRSEALALGLADIFWRAGCEEQAVVTIPSGRSIFSGSGRYRPDQLTETLVLNHFKKFEDLSGFLKDHIQQFEDDGQPGVVLTLYSVILSRTIKKVREDMDEPEGKLLGQHNYCSQEMVNLLLSGEAVSNTFNDYMLLDGMKLRGISHRCTIGFLSLFEHYKSCEVGTYYKTPKYPIFLVCSESHFSVLFCPRRELMSDWRVERRFDLYYYDGLANQDEEIRLTVVTSNKHYRPPADEDLIPPLELCIRTKWGEAEIDWNGTEPLL